MNIYANGFVNRYKVTKTIGFGLIPVEGTGTMIRNNTILENDIGLADSFKKMKVTCDRYHKEFIQDVLKTAAAPAHYGEYCALINSNSEKGTPAYDKALKRVRETLKAEISALFTKAPVYNDLFKKEFITELLPEFVKDREEEMYYDDAFKRRSTSFADYHTARRVMYGPDGSIARRIVEDNIPKHLSNVKAYKALLKTDACSCVSTIENELADILDGMNVDEWLSETTTVFSQDSIERYNAIIGGITVADRHIKGLNNYINEYNQTHSVKLRIFTKLYKMVLSDRVRLSWLPDAFQTDEDIAKAVTSFHREKISANNYEIRRKLLKMFADAVVSGVPDMLYYQGKELYGLSNELFGQAMLINTALSYYYEHYINPKWEVNFQKANQKKQEKMLAAKRKFVAPELISLALLDDVLMHYADECDSEDANKVAKKYHGYTMIMKACGDRAAMLMAKAEESYKVFEEGYGHKDLASLKPVIKTYLDSVLDLYRMVMLFAVQDMSLVRDASFYAAQEDISESLGIISSLYDMVRNYMTKKPFSTKKTELTFGKVGAFLGGWVDSHGSKTDNGTASGGYLFRRINEIGEYDYYLGVSLNSKLFRTAANVDEKDRSSYERLEYYQLDPKTVYGSSYKAYGSYEKDREALMLAIKGFLKRASIDVETRETLNDYLEGKMATPKGFVERLCNLAPEAYAALLEDADFKEANKNLIDKLAAIMSSQSRLEGSEIFMEKRYSLFTEIMADIESVTSQNRTFRYNPVSQMELEHALADEVKPLYLFRITNKDLSYAETAAKNLRTSRGRDQLHTMIFKALMSGNQNTYDIGTGKVFYRPASIPVKDTHPANVPIKAKTPGAKGKTNTFSYAIQKDRRYMKDSFFFQLSVFCNYSATGDAGQINRDMLRYLSKHKDVNLIGINRGEYNLLYITVIDQDGNILRDKNGTLLSYSLNTIITTNKNAKGDTISVAKPYREILDEREHQRQEERANWQDISSIKNLKAGYLSQVVSHLTSLMLEYNAVLVLEDLEGRFVQKRTAIEKSVYQQFEKAMINKLNFFFKKEFDINEPGGLMNAYQLTAPFTKFDDIHGQTGCIFYVSPWMVTKLDPTTGYTDMLYVNSDATEKAYKSFFAKMLGIRYNLEKGWFEFKFDYKDYDVLMPDDTRSEWTVCTHGETRWAYDRMLNNNKGGFKEVRVNEEIGSLFEEKGVIYKNGHDIKDEILQVNDRSFFASLYRLLKLVTQIHYRVPKKDIDILISPVAGPDGSFFNSATAEIKGLDLPYNGDANASYNIARKALFGIRNINPEAPWFRTPGKYEWLGFLQGN